MKVGDTVHYVEEVSGKDPETKKTPHGPCCAAVVVELPKPPECLPGAVKVYRLDTKTYYVPVHGFESNQYHLLSECREGH